MFDFVCLCLVKKGNDGYKNGYSLVTIIITVKRILYPPKVFMKRVSIRGSFMFVVSSRSVFFELSALGEPGVASAFSPDG